MIKIRFGPIARQLSIDRPEHTKVLGLNHYKRVNINLYPNTIFESCVHSATASLFSSRSVLSFLLTLIILLLFSSCSYNKIHHLNVKVSENNNFSDVPVKNNLEEHHLYQIIPKHQSLIKWYDTGHWCTWALFGNDDDGIFGEKQSKSPSDEPKTVTKALFWWCRNPLHNFCFYVIGSAHRQNSEFTLVELTPSHISFFSYLPISKTVFASQDTSFYLGLHGWKPFFSLRIRYTKRWRGDFYGGWRERGNFGLKFLPIIKIKEKYLYTSTL